MAKDKIAFKRSEGALSQEELSSVLGQKAKIQVNKNENITREVI